MVSNDKKTDLSKYTEQIWTYTCRQSITLNIYCERRDV